MQKTVVNRKTTLGNDVSCIQHIFTGSTWAKNLHTTFIRFERRIPQAPV
jgi:hypothetical protein